MKLKQWSRLHDYIIPLGKGNIVLHASEEKINQGESCCIITYGMGVYWAKAAAKNFKGQVEVIDLRTFFHWTKSWYLLPLENMENA